MKIKINLEVSENKSIQEVDLEDLDITLEKWESMSEVEKQETLQQYVYDSPSQPYWVVTGW